MAHAKTWHEKLYNHFGQYFIIQEILYKKKTEYHEVIIFKNSRFGKIMVIDGIVQTTEHDEFIYHEMLTHVPIFSHGLVKNVLIIGGGDGGILREVCRHKDIKNITMVEIDHTIINLCQKYFPNHSYNAYQDLRLKLIIDDGLNFIRETKETFDLIISDSTDPINYGKNLFSLEFYWNCKRCLNKNGLFVAQNGVFFLQKDETILTYKHLKNIFYDTQFYQAAIPTYYGGIMMFAWGTDNIKLRKKNIQDIQLSINNTKLNFNYYNAKIHISSFYLPQYIINELNKN
ncbi:polyamine aminopropyltransferase [Buchnera aphidicola (Macrosiphoniella sanborni)]|uniref:Polyamine aminopropyltransferase n=1 Tax=Buchnera aphidicola (Macrosiphoniella sanborni) TaxID=1241865 RepID=A0A4D6YCK5_9GAMM|nr:polyamine aminopropyltransferase [Buchnera aphidicola]QCI23758.1 polyamine aminopropyltransferase [Buchnera aphidicola (Macrosiphoniella sanborni)]